jgi:hypothetical protein
VNSGLFNSKTFLDIRSLFIGNLFMFNNKLSGSLL